ARYKMQMTDGEPDTLRDVSPVRGGAFGNLSQQCEKALGAYSTAMLKKFLNTIKRVKLLVVELLETNFFKKLWLKPLNIKAINMYLVEQAQLQVLIVVV
ncbi:hypothetical protein Q0N71_31910, partial [Bacillus thuringiensis]|uniref:hypothetical protein n=1 Tax=Bacillus thuringiensis TaxID=1428 RepID=UPI00345B33A3